AGPAPAGRCAVSLLVGLWQITHSSVVFRCPPCKESRLWQALHCAVATTVRRGVGVPPVSEMYLMGLMVDSCMAMSALPSARLSVALRRMSALNVQVPAEPAGMASAKV